MATIKNKNFMVKLPSDAELVLNLIREELKSAKFFNGLRNISLDDCYYQPDLSTPILTLVGFDDITDELMNRYIELIQKHSEIIEPDNETVTSEAFKVYAALLGKQSSF